MPAGAPLLRQLAGSQVGILGLGVAGVAMARALDAHGARLILADGNASLGPALQAAFKHSRVVVGPVARDVFAHCAWVAASPGVSPDHPALQFARAQNIAVVGEVELIALIEPAPKTLAITGTNGKSTATSLAGALARGVGLNPFVGGNLGDAMGNWIAEPQQSRPSTAILELSSYQIDGRVSYAPDVAVVLNVTPDHLARYGTFERYVQSKAQLIAALGPQGTAILNADDPATQAMAPLARGQVLWFTRQPQLPGWAGKGASGMVLQHPFAVPQGDVAQWLAPLALQHDVLLGAHNHDNMMAALLGVGALAAALGRGPLPQQGLATALQHYRGLPHRLEPVGTLRGVRYLNDSKATNDASCATAVRAMDGPFILLVGGQDKGGGYNDLLSALATHQAKAIVAFGAAKELLLSTLREVSGQVYAVDTLEDACAWAQQLSAPGDSVLLSPACTSFDAFKNYQHRGDTFAAWVRAQAGGVAP